MTKTKCSMCGKKLIKGKEIREGENNFCDVGCKDWYYETYLKEEKKEE